MTPADLRSIRARLNLSQGALARQLGLAQTTVSRYEQQKSPDAVIPTTVALAVEALWTRANAGSLGFDAIPLPNLTPGPLWPR